MKTRYFHIDGRGALAESTNAVDFFRREAQRAGAGFSWIDCLEPERIELEDIAVNFDLHRLSVDDCFEANPIPKIDIFPDYCSIVFNDVITGPPCGSEGGPAGIELSEVNYFLGRDFLLTVRREASERYAPLAKTVERLARGGVAGGAAMLLHALMDESTDRIFPVIESFADRVADMEDAALDDDGTFDAGELSVMRRANMTLRKSLTYERELVSRIRRRESALFPDAALPYFGDLYDHVAGYVDQAESNRDMIGNLVQMNLAMSSNAMAEASNRMNRSVSRLTFITVIFMPLTLIAGIFGMSEFTMFTGPEHWKIAYPLLIVGMVAIAAVTAGILRRMDSSGDEPKKRPGS